jgi:quercetin dioxygenase-like cupin family protein
MSKAGDTVENPVTGERVVVRVGTEDSGGELLVNEGSVRPGGAVVGEHVHPTIEETFEVLSGRLNFRIDGRESVAGPGERLRVPAGVAHDWWNAGEEEAHVVVEIRPGARFEEMGLNLFGLARGGRTNRKGMPNPLQAAVFAREFSDVFHFTRPPLAVQRPLFGALAALARALGYRGSYPRYSGALRSGVSGGDQGDGPPSAARVAAGAFAVAAPPLLASLLLLGGRAAPRPSRR